MFVKRPERRLRDGELPDVPSLPFWMELHCRLEPLRTIGIGCFLLAVKLKQLRLPGRSAESHDPNDNGGSRREGGRGVTGS